MIRVVYAMYLEDELLDARMVGVLEQSLLGVTLMSTSISGDAESRSYGETIYTGETTQLMRQAELCYITVQQQMAESQYNEFENILTEVLGESISGEMSQWDWKSFSIKDLVISAWKSKLATSHAIPLCHRRWNSHEENESH